MNTEMVISHNPPSLLPNGQWVVTVYYNNKKSAMRFFASEEEARAWCERQLPVRTKQR